MSDDEGCIIQLAIIATIVVILGMGIFWVIGTALNILDQVQQEVVEFLEDLEPPDIGFPGVREDPTIPRQLLNCAIDVFQKLQGRIGLAESSTSQTQILALASTNEDSKSSQSESSNQTACEYTVEPIDAGNLKVGEQAVVVDTTGQGLACRACPGRQDYLPELWLENGTIVSVKDGPVSVSQDEWLWWQVEAEGQNACWAAEAIWLVPLESEEPTPLPIPIPVPTPTPPPPLPVGWCRGDLDAKDLGGGELCDQSYFVDFASSDYPGMGDLEPRIFYNNRQRSFSYWGAFNDEITGERVQRWGISTWWAYVHRDWRDDSRWYIEFPCRSESEE